jgi:uncharacterized protein (TIGR03000 family)
MFRRSRFMLSRAFWSVAVVCALLSATGRAQPPAGHGTGICSNYGYPYGPRVAPAWGYPGITGGAYVTYPSPPGKPPVDPSRLVRYPLSMIVGFDANGPSLCGPRVPVYGPIPTVMDNPQLKREWLSMNHPNLAGYGWFGLRSALPRPKNVSVNVWPVPRPGDSPETSPPPAAPAEKEKSGEGMVITVKLPQANAEVLVDGKPTTQTGTDRTFESPPLEAGTYYKYTVTARWMEDGKPIEKSQTAIGTRGGKVHLEFSR